MGELARGRKPKEDDDLVGPPVREMEHGRGGRSENGSNSFRPIWTETDSDCLGSDFSRIIFGSETNSDFFLRK